MPMNISKLMLAAILFISTIAIVQPAIASDTNVITVFMIGDSTMANKPLVPPNPERGWGQLLPMYFRDDVRIDNHAMNGRSTKSFINEGRWKTVRNAIKPGDYVIIEFGHNDEKTNDVKRATYPFTTFKTNLMMFVTEARAHGATPILATPTARRKFDETGKIIDTHGDYVTATRQVAGELHVPLLDLNKRSTELLVAMGPELSKKLYDWIAPVEYSNRPKGIKDDTHFNAYGASRMCDLAIIDLKSVAPDLAAHLKAETKVNQGGLEK